MADHEVGFAALRAEIAGMGREGREAAAPLRPAGLTITRLRPLQIEVSGLPDGGRVLTVFDNGRMLLKEVLDEGSAAHLAALLLPRQSRGA